MTADNEHIFYMKDKFMSAIQEAYIDSQLTARVNTAAAASPYSKCNPTLAPLDANGMAAAALQDSNDALKETVEWKNVSGLPCRQVAAVSQTNCFGRLAWGLSFGCSACPLLLCPMRK